MTIKVKIIFLHNQDTSDLGKSEGSLDKLALLVKRKEFCEMVSTNIPNVKIVETVITRPIYILMQKILLTTCNSNEIDIIFITGDIEFTDKHYANELIKAMVNRTEFSTELTNMITEIQKKLEEFTHYRTRCGICIKTLLINLSGLGYDKRECLATISDTLVHIVNLINYFRENQHFSLSDSACSFDNDFSEQDKDEDANVFAKPSSSLTSSHSSLTENTNNCHKELFPRISFESAMKVLSDIVYEYINEKNPELINVNDAYGRILLENIYSKCNVPPFRTSNKHGYAVLVNDGKGMRKVQEEENRLPPLPLEPGTCVWVSSGAPIPEEATAVVQVKDTKRLEGFPNNDGEYIEIMIQPQCGQNIKSVGYDMMKGNIIVKKFTRIGPEEIRLLAISGCKKVIVAKQLSIGVLSIGDNLEEPGEPLKPGFVYDINRITLISLLKHNGYSSLDFGIVNNNLSSIRKKFEEALKEVDILVTTGCVNDKDLLKNILMKYFKAKIHFGNVNIKPGKSTTLASCKINDETKYFMCLSGNPTSAFISAHLFLLLFVNKLHCNVFSEPPVVPVQTEASFLLHRRPRFALTRLQWSDEENLPTAYNMCNLYKDRLYNIVGSNALLILPEGNQKKLVPKTNNMLALLIDNPRSF